MVKDATAQQPPPVRREGQEEVWPLLAETLRQCAFMSPDRSTWLAVAADCEARSALGRERYGTPLTTNNGRDALVDAYQEALDGLFYLTQYCRESGGTMSARVLVERQATLCLLLRRELGDRP